MLVVWAQLSVGLALCVGADITVWAAPLATLGIALLALVDVLGLWGLVLRLRSGRGEYLLVWIGAVVGGLVLNASAFVRSHPAYMFWLGMVFWFAVGGICCYLAAMFRSRPGERASFGRRLVVILGYAGALLGFGYFVLGGVVRSALALGFDTANRTAPSSTLSSDPHIGWMFWIVLVLILANLARWGLAYRQLLHRRRIYKTLAGAGEPLVEVHEPEQVRYASDRDFISSWRRPLTAVGLLYRSADAWLFKGIAPRSGKPFALRLPVPLAGVTRLREGKFLFRTVWWLAIRSGDETHNFSCETGISFHPSKAITADVYERVLADTVSSSPSSPTESRKHIPGASDEV